jgi:hypothetical protein
MKWHFSFNSSTKLSKYHYFSSELLSGPRNMPLLLFTQFFFLDRRMIWESDTLEAAVDSSPIISGQKS